MTHIESRRTECLNKKLNLHFIRGNGKLDNNPLQKMSLLIVKYQKVFEKLQKYSFCIIIYQTFFSTKTHVYQRVEVVVT